MKPPPMVHRNGVQVAGETDSLGRNNLTLDFVNVPEGPFRQIMGSDWNFLAFESLPDPYRNHEEETPVKQETRTKIDALEARLREVNVELDDLTQLLKRHGIKLDPNRWAADPYATGREQIELIITFPSSFKTYTYLGLREPSGTWNLTGTSIRPAKWAGILGQFHQKGGEIVRMSDRNGRELNRHTGKWEAPEDLPF